MSSECPKIYPLTQKCLLSLPLFSSVKAVNGQHVFRTLLSEIKSWQYSRKCILDDNLTNHSFMTILQGSVSVYKYSQHNQTMVQPLLTSSIKSSSQHPHPQQLSYNRSEKYQDQQVQYSICEWQPPPQNPFLNKLMTVPQPTTHSQRARTFVTYYRPQDTFGYQEYTINWQEQLMMQASQGTILISLPLSLSSNTFRRVLPTSLTQDRIDQLRSVELFMTVTLKKLIEAVWHCRKKIIQKQQTLFLAKQYTDHLIIVLDGQLKHNIDEPMLDNLIRKHEVIGYRELVLQLPFDHDIVCVQQGEVLLMPKKQFWKLKQWKYQEMTVQAARKSNQTGQRKHENFVKNWIEQFQAKRGMKSQALKSMICNKIQHMRRRRPKTTESCTIQKQLPNKKPHSMSTTFYHSNLKVKAKHSEKTIKTDYSNPDYLPIDAPMHTSFDNARKTNNNQSSQNIPTLTPSQVSLGELCLRTFIHRKQRRENKELMKYLSSNPPQLERNPGLQCAIVQPMHVNQSNYVRQLKRKFRKSVKLADQKPEIGNKTMRFSLFFKQSDI